MDLLLPILSGSLNEVLENIVRKTKDPIAQELIDVNKLVESYNDCVYSMSDILRKAVIDNCINTRITDEVRMITIRPSSFEVSFLPKDKEPEYSSSGTWSRKNRQSGKPARIFQKLLVKEFKTREWEIFANLFKSELCDCANFEIVSGEDIRYWYYEEHYYRCDGSLGNSCMRYEDAQPYFDIYVDHAKMLITKKDGLLTGRALIWEMDGITILDRIYTCFDYLENCFIDYARENGWWIRENNSLLNTGNDQKWLTPEDNYENVVKKQFILNFDKDYTYMPYVDSFRYYDGGHRISTTRSDVFCYALDDTDGDYRGYDDCYVCDNCGEHMTEDEACYSEAYSTYYCEDCCWYCNPLCDYYPNNDAPVCIYEGIYSNPYPKSYLDDYLVANPTGSESEDDVVEINDHYYFVKSLTWNPETNCYEIRSNSN